MRSLTVALAFVVVLAGLPAVAATLRIDAPREEVPLVGPVTVTFSLTGPGADALERATVLFDGRVVGVVTGPPLLVTFDAGDELKERRIEVRATLRTGETLSAVRNYARPAGSEVQVRLVNLAVTVTDRSGKPVQGLGKDDFTILDNGQPVPIDRWDAEPRPLAVALVIDTSLSMQGDRIDAARRAASAFAEAFDDNDLVGVFAFADDVAPLVPFGAEKVKASAAISGLQAQGGTALYDAVFAAAEALATIPPTHRRVLVLLSDGRDEAASGLEPGSLHTLDESIHRAHQADAVVFAVGLGAILDREIDFTGRMTTAEVLQRLSGSTGGVYRRITRWTRLTGFFEDVLNELRQQYGMAYSPPPARPGETWRKIDVRVNRPSMSVRTREGYFVAD